MLVAALYLEGLPSLGMHPVDNEDDMVVVLLKVVHLKMARNVISRAVALQRKELSLLVGSVLLSLSMINDTSMACRYLLLSLFSLACERLCSRVCNSITTYWSE